MWNIASELWGVVDVWRGAFSAAWSGTADQWMVVFTGICVVFLLVLTLYVWRRDGGDVLRQRFRDAPQMIALARAQRGRRPVKARLLYLVLWIVIPLAVVYLQKKNGG